MSLLPNSGYYEGSHEVERISAGPRDPNRFPALRRLGEMDRWRAVCEYRFYSMDWLFCSPKL